MKTASKTTLFNMCMIRNKENTKCSFNTKLIGTWSDDHESCFELF